MIILSAKNVEYLVKGRQIIKDTTFSLHAGEKVALLGANGAGKSTLLDILTQAIRPTSGKVTYQNGNDFEQVKKHYGVVWGNMNIFPFLKVKEVIHFLEQLYAVRPGDYAEAYHILGIDKIKDQRVNKLSGGERQRMHILLACMHSPAILLLDEPTAELDPLVRDSVWKNIFLKSSTILFTTHQWDEAKKYAASVMFMQSGKILNGPVPYDTLLSESGFQNKIVTLKNHHLEIPVGAFAYEKKEEYVILLTDGTFDEMLHTVRQATRHFSVLPVEMEDIYMFMSHNKVL